MQKGGKGAIGTSSPIPKLGQTLDHTAEIQDREGAPFLPGRIARRFRSRMSQSETGLSFEALVFSAFVIKLDLNDESGARLGRTTQLR